MEAIYSFTICAYILIIFFALYLLKRFVFLFHQNSLFRQRECEEEDVGGNPLLFLFLFSFLPVLLLMLSRDHPVWKFMFRPVLLDVSSPEPQFAERFIPCIADLATICGGLLLFPSPFPFLKFISPSQIS